MELVTRAQLINDLRNLGVREGDALMLHASLRRVGPIDGGADTLIDALEAAVGPRGTLLMVLGAHTKWEHATTPTDPVAPALPAGVEPFDAAVTPVLPEVGTLAEVFRARAGTMVSDNPSGRFGARGAYASALVGNAPWHDYYGDGSPLERLCDLNGRILRLGANPDTVTVLHFAEYLARVPSKRAVRRYFAVRRGAGVELVHVDCLDDEHGIVDWPGDDYFALILRDYLALGRERSGRVGNAHSELIEAADILQFGVKWMEEKFAG